MLGKIPVSASTITPLSKALSTSENDKILIIARLKGGNDGLNTVIPYYDYDTYANLRPTLRIKQNDSFALSNDFKMLLIKVYLILVLLTFGLQQEIKEIIYKQVFLAVIMRICIQITY